VFADSVNASWSIGEVGSALILNAHWVRAVLMNTDLDEPVGQLGPQNMVQNWGWYSRSGHVLTGANSVDESDVEG
jgi:hypothetical protein